MSVESILSIIEKNVIHDYYTAGIKTEVVIDTLITPVITELIKEMLENSGDKSIAGDLVYITKEFPMIKHKEDGSYDSFRNTKADYLLMDKNTVYLVELKTSMDSMEKTQITNYRNYMDFMDGKDCLKIMLDEFFALFKSVSDAGIKETEQGKNKPALPELVRHILKNNSTQTIEENETDNKERTNKDKAMEFLKSKNASSSKKYLTQAVDILENIYLENKNKYWKNIKNIQLIYIVPSDDYKGKICMNTDDKDIIKCSFGSLKYEDDHGDDYYKWVKDQILKPLFCKSES